MRYAGIALASFLAVLGASAPALAGRVCSNVLSGGRIIVQGRLVDSFGAACSRAVLLPRSAAGGRPLIIDASRFNDRVIVLGPRDRGRGRTIVLVEPPLLTPRFAAPPFGTFAFGRGFGSAFATTGGGRFTTGSIGPFTTFSNSGAVPVPSVSLAAPRQRVIGGRGFLLGRRR